MRRSLVIKRLSNWERASEEVLPIDIPSISMVLADPFAVMMAALSKIFSWRLLKYTLLRIFVI